jgi:hypothetical protein
MAQPYQLLNDTETVLRIADQAYIPPDPANRDRQEYDAWCAEGNVADPAPPLPEPPAPEPLKLPLAMPVEPMDAVPKVYLENMINPLIARLDALERKLG